jgi:hypothetical protein
VELQLEHGLGLAAAAAPPRLEHVGGAALGRSLARSRNRLCKNDLRPPSPRPLPLPLGQRATPSRERPPVAALQCRARKKPPVRVTPPGSVV